MSGVKILFTHIGFIIYKSWFDIVFTDYERRSIIQNLQGRLR